MILKIDDDFIIDKKCLCKIIVVTSSLHGNVVTKVNRYEFQEIITNNILNCYWIDVEKIEDDAVLILYCEQLVNLP